MKNRESLFPRSIICGAAVLSLLHLGFAFTPLRYTWGLHYLLFFPVPVRMGAAALALLLCLPQVNRRAALFVGKTLTRLPAVEGPAGRAFLTAAAAVVSGAMFWLLRSRTHFLGDGYYLIRSLVQGTKVAMGKMLDDRVHMLVFKMMGGGGEPAAEKAYAMLSVFAGVVSIVCWIHIARTLAAGRVQRLIIFGLLATTGVVQLFFGYAEAYSLMMAALSVYLLTALYALNDRLSLAIPSCALALAFGFHALASLFIPSLLYLYVRRLRTPADRPHWRHAAITTVSLLFPLLCAVAAFPRSSLSTIAEVLSTAGTWNTNVMLTLRPHPGAPYSLFGLPHVMDFIALLFHSAPAAVLVSIVMLVFAPGCLRSADPVVRFLFIAFAVCITATFCFNAALGFARDWDVMSLWAVPLTLLCGYLFVRCTRDTRALLRAALPLLAMTLLHTGSWVLVNASKNRSMERFESLALAGAQLDLDYCYEELGIYYRDRGMMGKAVQYFQRCLQLAPGNPRYLLDLCFCHSVMGRHSTAIDYCTEAAKNAPDYPEAHFGLAAAYATSGDISNAEKVYRRVLDFNPNHAPSHVMYGKFLRAVKRYGEARAELETALRLDPGNSAVRRMLNDLPR